LHHHAALGGCLCGESADLRLRLGLSDERERAIKGFAGTREGATDIKCHAWFKPMGGALGGTQVC
jgi:hypothetical protein